MLEAPRDLLALALLPLNPLEPPPKPPAFDGLPFGMFWLPIRSPPPLPPRFAVAGPAARLLVLGLAPRFPPPLGCGFALAPPLRLPPAGCCLALACLVLGNCPLADPPYLFAVAWLE